MDNRLAGKVLAVITVGAARWGGQEVAAEHVLTCAFNHGMVLAPSRPKASEAWRVCGVATAPGEIVNDSEAIRAAEDLGRRLARLRPPVA
jgi:multimeric flavodoxin WrbA